MIGERERPLRIGGVPYLNGQPLTAWLRSDSCDADVEYVEEVPSRLAELLADDSLDVAIVSSIEAIRNPRVLALPDMSIACYGPVRSVRIFSKVPVQRIRTLAADNSSLTSVALAQGLLKESYGLTVNMLTMPPDPVAMLDSCDAAVMIGDRALLGVDAPHVLDLGAAWKEHTGLPFVFALWLVNDPAVGARAHSILRRAHAWGCARRAQIARDWSRPRGMPLDMATEYLVSIMQYDLDAAKRAALDRFSEMCGACGLTGSAQRVRYVTV
ncbi:MAG: menaquinone biosynthesis protein [Chthonomonadales bacterium]|nr:menaquinone biosynthesis protein [Chthonomonadales bacterium]